MTPSRLPALERFLGAYFHQDFRVDAGSLENAVDQLHRAAPRNLRRVHGELAELLAGAPTEPELLEFLDAAGVEIDVSRVAGSAREWLDSLELALRRASSNGDG